MIKAVGIFWEWKFLKSLVRVEIFSAEQKTIANEACRESECMQNVVHDAQIPSVAARHSGHPNWVRVVQLVAFP